jgi:hypothetical protein
MNNESQSWTATMRKNTSYLGIWTGTWLVSMALAAFGPKLLWNFHTVLTVSAILINLAVGAGVIHANIRYLNGLDELHRKIQLEAFAIALGVGVIAGLSYSLLDTNNIISFDAEISHMVMLIGITYLITFASNMIRFR